MKIYIKGQLIAVPFVLIEVSIINTPILEEHYGVNVWTNVEMDKKRKTECLCKQCSVGYCPMASRAYELCKQFDTAMMITRCKSFKPIKRKS